MLIGDCYLPVNYIKQYKFFSNPGMFLHLLADEMEENNLGDGNKSVEPESSLSLTPISGNEGPLLTLRLTATADCDDGQATR